MNIFVAKLDYGTTSETLRSTFEAFGTVDSAKVIMDRDTGRSKGFGFVEMPNDDEANQAISDLNMTELDGREIVVKEAKPREERGNRGGFRRNNNNRFNNRDDRYDREDRRNRW